MSKSRSLYNLAPRIISHIRLYYDDIFIAIILGIIIGGRLGHVLFYERQYYSTHIGEIRHIRKGGMSFMGGCMGVCVALLIHKYRFRLTYRDFFYLSDLIILVVPLGIMLGRRGNFINQELYGITLSQAQTLLGTPIINIIKTLGMTHIYHHIDTAVRINTNLIAGIMEGCIIAMICRYIAYLQYTKKKRRSGYITRTFLLLYGITRFLGEYIRSDSQQEFKGLLTITQWFCVVIFGLLLIHHIVTHYGKTHFLAKKTILQ